MILQLRTKWIPSCRLPSCPTHLQKGILKSRTNLVIIVTEVTRSGTHSLSWGPFLDAFQRRARNLPLISLSSSLVHEIAFSPTASMRRTACKKKKHSIRHSSPPPPRRLLSPEDSREENNTQGRLVRGHLVLYYTQREITTGLELMTFWSWARILIYWVPLSTY